MFDKTFKFVRGNDSNRFTSMVVREVCEAVNTPRSLTVWLLFSNNEHQQLVDLEINPLHYLTSHAFADDYLVSEFLSKADFLNLETDRKKKAMEAFSSYEELCKATNERIDASINSNERAVWINHAVTEKLKKWLPRLDTNVLGQVFESCKWGPGVTSSSKGSHLSRYNKLQARLDATPDLIQCGAHFLVNSIPAWACFHTSKDIEAPASILQTAFTAVPGNTVTTVPKNAKTDRTIAVEPHVNAIFQRGVGVFLRKILDRHGYNLRDQTRNQKLAKLGSKSGTLATIDLKGASDTISSELVKLVLPPDWFSLLENLRSRYYQLEGNWVRYHKHSSMGNGYTFELESLIFSALAESCCEYLNISTENVSVYGDDIIIPSEASKLFLEMVGIYGFVPNQKKTFTSGPFRESCGADFFDGINVRPFYIRKRITDLASVYTLANTIRSYSAMRCNYLGSDGRFRRVWGNITRFIPKAFRIFVPCGYDGGFHSEFDEATPGTTNSFSPRCISRHTISGRGTSLLQFKRLIWVSRTSTKTEPTVTVGSALWDMESLEKGPMSPSSVVDRTKYDLRERGKWQFSRCLTDVWEGPGSWIV